MYLWVQITWLVLETDSMSTSGALCRIDCNAWWTGRGASHFRKWEPYWFLERLSPKFSERCRSSFAVNFGMLTLISHLLDYALCECTSLEMLPTLGRMT